MMSHPFSARPYLVLTVPDSDLSGFLAESYILVQRHPVILERIDTDLDRHALAKKAMRLRDAQWEEAQNSGLPHIDETVPRLESKALQLGAGRPRTPALLVYLAMALRGYQGGFKSSDTAMLMQESVTWSVVVANLGLDAPRPGTLDDLVNQVSNETRTLVHDKQIEDVLEMSWDNFAQLLMDSTAVEGNTEWPKDSRLMVVLVERFLHMGERLEKVGLPAFTDAQATEWLKKMAGLDKQINLGAGKAGAEAERTTLYNKLLHLAGRVRRRMQRHLESTAAALKKLAAQPSTCERAGRIVAQMQSDLDNLGTVMSCCRKRVVQGQKVPISEKVLSTADSDVGFIAKGGREPVVGYKPQLARSGEGFIVGFLLPQGNAADSTQLLPLFEQSANRTCIIPHAVSVDDGYASDDGRAQLLEYGVQVASVGGSKGKRITPEEDWDSPGYVAARNHRSAVESLMFTIKHNFDFGRVARRGLERVTAEMLEKVLAYNFCRMSSSRRQDREEEPEHAVAA